MRVGVLITNGGTHTPQQWASETAAQITDVIVIDPASIVADSMRVEKEKLASVITSTLEQFHDQEKTDEITRLETTGLERLNEENSPNTNHLNDAVKAVCEVTDKTIFGPHYRKPEVIRFVQATIGSHFTTVRHCERSWYADRFPESEQSKTFHARFV